MIDIEGSMKFRSLWIVFAVTAVTIAALISYCWYKSFSRTHQHQEYHAPELRVPMIEETFGIKPEFFADEGVAKVTIPRTDLSVYIHNKPLAPFMGLLSWASFKKGKKPGIEVMIMGDLVFLEEEVNPALSIALEHGIEVTALHNHFFYDQPKLYYMHINAEGDLEPLARGIREILASTQNKNTSKSSAKLVVDNAIDGSPLEGILGVMGKTQNGVFKIAVGRETHAACGCKIGKNMGVQSWAAFAGTNEYATIDGDIAVLEHELQDVLKILRSHDVQVVAIHNHMVGENPRMLFVHYWGEGEAAELAKILRIVLDRTK